MNKQQLNPQLRVLTLTLCALLLSACGIGDFFKDEGEEIQPTPLEKIKPTLSVSRLWSKNIGQGDNLNFVNLRPAISDNQVFIASRPGVVMALDADTGKVIWRANTYTQLGGGPGVGEALVLVGSHEGEIIALDITNGKRIWRSRATSEVLSVPAAAGGMVVASAIDGRLFGLSAVDGKRIWVYDRSVPPLTLRGSSSPVIVGALVIYGSDSGKLSALSLKEGLPLWEKSVAFPSGRSELDRIVDIDGNPLVISGIIYAASYQGGIAAIELETSRTIWTKENISTAVDMGADQRNLYITDADGVVLALDRHNGALVWEQESLQYRNVTGALVVDKYVVVGDFEGYQHWLSTDDGHFVARVKTAGGGVSNVTVSDDGKVFSYSKNGELTVTRIKR